jgi:hypothetical protein
MDGWPDGRCSSRLRSFINLARTRFHAMTRWFSHQQCSNTSWLAMLWCQFTLYITTLVIHQYIKATLCAYCSGRSVNQE